MTRPGGPNQHKLRVLIVGPMAPAVGGMVTVIEQLFAGPLSDEFDLLRHAANGTDRRHWLIVGSIIRHLGHLVRFGWRILHSGVDAVHIHTCSGFTFYRNLLDAELARWCGVPVVLHVHGAQFDQFCAASGRAGRALIGYGLTRADRVVVLSQRWRDLLAPYAPRARFAVVPNGVPVPADAPPDRHPPGDGACRFLFLGALGPRKGTDTLLNAVGQVQARGLPVRLTLAGPHEDPGPDGHWPTTAGRLGIADCVEFVGPVTGFAKDRLLDDCDVLVLPSRAEGLPLVLLEAGARGVPVVATAVGATPEVIDDPALGLIVPPDDPRRLADAMAAMIRDPTARAGMGTALRARVRARYSLHQQSALLADIYRAVTATSRARQPLTLRSKVKGQFARTRHHDEPRTSVRADLTPRRPDRCYPRWSNT